jgi:hypothetical protein
MPRRAAAAEVHSRPSELLRSIRSSKDPRHRSRSCSKRSFTSSAEISSGLFHDGIGRRQAEGSDHDFPAQRRIPNAAAPVRRVEYLLELEGFKSDGAKFQSPFSWKCLKSTNRSRKSNPGPPLRNRLLRSEAISKIGPRGLKPKSRRPRRNGTDWY